MLQERAYQDKNLSHTGFRVLAYLAWIAKDGSVEGITQDELATRLNMAPRTLTRAVEELVQGGYLFVERKGGRTANTLTLLGQAPKTATAQADSTVDLLTPILARLAALENRWSDQAQLVMNDLSSKENISDTDGQSVKNDHTKNEDENHTECEKSALTEIEPVKNDLSTIAADDKSNTSDNSLSVASTKDVDTWVIEPSSKVEPSDINDQSLDTFDKSLVEDKNEVTPEIQSAQNDQSAIIDHTKVKPHKKAQAPFGDRLKTWRKQHNLTQSEAALRLEINPSTYRGYEAGRRQPTTEVLEQCLLRMKG